MSFKAHPSRVTERTGYMARLEGWRDSFHSERARIRRLRDYAYRALLACYQPWLTETTHDISLLSIYLVSA